MDIKRCRFVSSLSLQGVFLLFRVLLVQRQLLFYLVEQCSFVLIACIFVSCTCLVVEYLYRHVLRMGGWWAVLGTSGL